MSVACYPPRPSVVEARMPLCETTACIRIKAGDNRPAVQVTPCPKRFKHDWVDCAYAHKGEKARRHVQRGTQALPYTHASHTTPRAF